MKNIVDKETQKSLEIIHLREILLDLLDAIEHPIITNNIDIDKMFEAIRTARTSIQ
jgi:hypothetical protein